MMHHKHRDERAERTRNYFREKDIDPTQANIDNLMIALCHRLGCKDIVDLASDIGFFIQDFTKLSNMSVLDFLERGVHIKKD